MSESPSRRVATRVLHRVAQDGAWAMPALDAEISRASLDARDAALATEIAYGTLRVLPAIDASLDGLLKKPSKTDPVLRAALRVAAYQLAHLSRVPSHAVVSDAVSLVKRERGPRLAGVANAVLRKLAAARPESPSRPTRQVLPAWLEARLHEALGPERARAFLEARRLPPPLGLRALGDRDALLEAIRAAQPDAELEAIGARGIAIRGGGDPRTLPGYAEGRFALQELGAQRVTELVGAAPGERVADLCCGHGTKTLALAEAVGDGGRVEGVDLHEDKLERLEWERRRLGIDEARVGTRAVDLTVGLGGLAEASFDRVLCDAPCTGVGTLHRRPELALRLSPDDPARLGALQIALLEAALRLVRPGGVLVYAVCSVTEEEGRRVKAAFEAAHPSAEADLEAQIGPWDGDFDAYYVARWTIH